MNKSLMSYTGSNPTQEKQYGARKYVGDVATGYDAKRKAAPKWAAEQRIIEGFIDILEIGSKILDVPVGTGRFIPAYERNDHDWRGVDKSVDMLKEAAAKVTKSKPNVINLSTGDATCLDFDDGIFDMSIMCRLTRWLTPEQRTQALKELQRVTKSKIVFTARIANHPYAYPMEDIHAALNEDWELVENIECGEPDYRVIVLERR
jgi:ubiquinone/menaquinone biosynthesis C-methylase UbiE